MARHGSTSGYTTVYPSSTLSSNTNTNKSNSDRDRDGKIVCKSSVGMNGSVVFCMWSLFVPELEAESSGTRILLCVLLLTPGTFGLAAVTAAAVL